MKFLAALFALFAFFALAIAQDPQTATGPQLEVTGNPGAGRVDFHRVDSGRTFSFSFDEVKEVSFENAGVPNAINSFNAANFQVSVPQFEQGTVNFTRLNLNANSLPIARDDNETRSADLTVEVRVVHSEEAEYTFQGTTYEVTPKFAFFQFTLSNWPFDSNLNDLNVRMSISTPGRSGEVSGNDKVVLYDGATLFFPARDNTRVSFDSNSNGLTMRFNATSSVTYGFAFVAEGSGSSASIVSSFLASLF